MAKAPCHTDEVHSCVLVLIENNLRYELLELLSVSLQVAWSLVLSRHKSIVKLAVPGVLNRS